LISAPIKSMLFLHRQTGAERINSMKWRFKGTWWLLIGYNRLLSNKVDVADWVLRLLCFGRRKSVRIILFNVPAQYWGSEYHLGQYLKPFFTQLDQSRGDFLVTTWLRPRFDAKWRLRRYIIECEYIGFRVPIVGRAVSVDG